MATPVVEKKFESDEEFKLSKPFIMRRLHSLLGFWLVIYLFEHLLVNSQAALFFLDKGHGFIKMVNKLEDLPYLAVIEWLFLGVPFFIHGIWGLKYALTAKYNSHKTDGSRPALPQYRRNRGYTWQRITSWILFFAIILHVAQMRVFDGPKKVDSQHLYVVQKDAGIEGVVKELNGTFKEIEKNKLEVAVPTAGAAFFLLVRETFKSPLMVLGYSIFVIAACYHAFNGLWTFMIKWGITLTRRSQKRMRTFANILMYVTMFLGLMAAWGTYWTTLFQI